MTLTALHPRRGVIDEQLKQYPRYTWRNDIYFATGSDKPQTVEQLGEDLFNCAKKVYNCSGNDVYEKDKCIQASNGKYFLKIQKDCYKNVQTRVSIQTRTGNLIEKRKGCVNFSIVGRNAEHVDRKDYYNFDKLLTGERLHLLQRLLIKQISLNCTGCR